jgi:hypothetical protein
MNCVKPFFRRSRFRFLPLAVSALASFISVTAADAGPARLIIHRAPNFGSRQWLRIWIDHTEFKAIAIGHDFTSTISPGRHVIAVLPMDNPWHFRPTTLLLNARADRTYEFTAAWNNDRVYLE